MKESRLDLIQWILKNQKSIGKIYFETEKDGYSYKLSGLQWIKNEILKSKEI